MRNAHLRLARALLARPARRRQPEPPGAGAAGRSARAPRSGACTRRHPCRAVPGRARARRRSSRRSGRRRPASCRPCRSSGCRRMLRSTLPSSSGSVERRIRAEVAARPRGGVRSRRRRRRKLTSRDASSKPKMSSSSRPPVEDHDRVLDTRLEGRAPRCGRPAGSHAAFRRRSPSPAPRCCSRRSSPRPGTPTAPYRRGTGRRRAPSPEHLAARRRGLCLEGSTSLPAATRLRAAERRAPTPTYARPPPTRLVGALDRVADEAVVRRQRSSRPSMDSPPPCGSSRCRR